LIKLFFVSRGRILKRQQCQESNEEGEGVTKIEPPTSPPRITVNTPPVKRPKSFSPSPIPSPPPEEHPISPAPVSPHPETSRQPSIDPLCGLESVPLLYSSSGPGPRLPPSNLLRPHLPSVRVIPEPEPMHELLPHPCHQSVPSPSLLYPIVPTYEHLSPMHTERKPPKPRHTENYMPLSSSSGRPVGSMEQFGHCPKVYFCSQNRNLNYRLMRDY